MLSSMARGIRCSVYLQSGIWYERYMQLFHGKAPNQKNYLFYSIVYGHRYKLTQPAVNVGDTLNSA